MLPLTENGTYETASPPHEPQGTPRTAAVACLLSFAALIAGVRLYSYNEPLERDLTTYAVIGHEMLQGRSLYSDLWDHKPPLIHITYAFGELVAGYGQGQAYILGVLSAVVTMLAAYCAAVALDGSRATGLWAAAFWVVISSNIGLQANQPNTESFINACLAWAFVLLVRPQKSPVRISGVVAVGVLLGLASLYKNVAAAGGLCLAGAHLAFPPQGARRDEAFRHTLVIGGVGVLLWLGVCGYFAVRGCFGDFYDAVFAYNFSYAGGAGNIASTMARSLYYPYFLDALFPFLVVTALGTIVGIRGAERRPWGLLAGYAVGAQVAVGLHGHLNQHYYQLWLPALAIGTAWGISLLRRALEGRRPWVAPAVAAAIVVAAVLHQLPFYRSPAEQLPAMKCEGGGLFIESRKVGEEIRSILERGETFYLWGSETGVYFAGKCSPPTGVFYNYPLLEGPLQEVLTERVLADIERSPPEMLVLPARGFPAHPVVEWFKPRYELFPDDPVRGNFALLFRRGGRLEARLLRKAKGLSPDE